MEFYLVGIGSIIIGFFLGILKEAIKDLLKYRSKKETVTFEQAYNQNKLDNKFYEKQLDKQIGKLKHDLVSQGYDVAEHKESGGFLRKKKIFIRLVKN